MTDPALLSSTTFLDGIHASVRDTLAALDRHEAALGEAFTRSPDREPVGAVAVGRLEAHLAGWQNILGAMADQVRAAQDELDTLDADLNRALDAFAAARKHLQGVS